MATDRFGCIVDSDCYEIRTCMVYSNLVIFTINLTFNLDRGNKAS
jgi:hypothetical protein